MLFSFVHSCFHTYFLHIGISFWIVNWKEKIAIAQCLCYMRGCNFYISCGPSTTCAQRESTFKQCFHKLLDASYAPVSYPVSWLWLLSEWILYPCKYSNVYAYTINLYK